MSGIMRARFVVGTAVVLALSLVVAACGGGGGGQGGEEISGEISVEGSSTVQPITQAAAELFREQNPDARISVGGAGTSDGFEAFCQGDTQISDASARPPAYGFFGDPDTAGVANYYGYLIYAGGY